MKANRNNQTADYLLISGVFVAILGAIGYVTHPEKAVTELMFGGGVGAALFLSGILGAKGLRWSRFAGLLTTTLLAAACAWRAALGWMAVTSGQSDRAFASILVTLMLAVSVLMGVVLIKDGKPGDAGKLVEKPT